MTNASVRPACASALASRTTAMPLLVVACLAACATACRQGGTPVPPPTVVVMHAQGIPSPTVTPVPSATPVASQTPIPTAMPSAVFDASAGAPEAGCAIPLDMVSWTLEPGAEAPADAHAQWTSRITQTLTADVLAHDEARRVFTLQAADGAVAYPFVLRYSTSAPPLAVGRRYRFTSHQDQPGQASAGSALRVDDDKGLLYFGASVRETDGAAARLLGGDTGGFRVRQLATRCAHAFVDPCGFELRSAPVDVARGDKAITLSAGGTGSLPSQPPYQATVFTSHYRLWREDRACPDPRDTILSYQLVRMDA